MPPELVAGPGALARLPEVLERWRPRRVLLVGSRRAVTSTGALGLLGGATVTWYDAVRPNPTWFQVAELIRLVDRSRPDVVVGLGGGSTLDTAKVGRLVNDPGPPAPDRSPGLRKRAAKLVLVPTTAGSGSEVTRVATVYVDGERRAVSDPRMLADVAVLDPRLTESCPPAVTWPAAFDALSHAVESYWSVRSTPASRALAWPAVVRLGRVLSGPPDQPLPEPGSWQRAVLAAGATRAGQAIDQTGTTAPHAFSYWLTAHRQVPHGLACLLNLLWVLPYNAAQLAGGCADPRGPGFLADRLRALSHALAGPGGTPTTATETLAALIRRAGWSDRLGTYGLDRGSVADFVRAGLARDRNNPVRLDPDLLTAAVLARI